MKHIQLLMLSLLLAICTSCFNDMDDVPAGQNEIKDFVYQGMNAAYLYKDDVPDFDVNKSQKDGYIDYLNQFSSPTAFFEHLIYDRETIDRFSWITDDYIALENYFKGESLSNGMDFSLIRFPEGSNSVLGYVRYVAKNSTAEQAGIQRGDLFTAVNGTNLTADNYYDLLFKPNNYTLNLANYNPTNNSVTPNGETVSLSKIAFTENPILINKTLTVNNTKIGYLMYNSFTGTNAFDSQLNTVFGQFKSEGISDLVLDLRYNPGGSVRTAIWLCSMITGDYTGETLLKQQWNKQLQEQFESESPERLIYTFESKMIKKTTSGEVVFEETINHLNLKRVYVLTTKGTASASELIINGLKPYIDVIQIGDTTTGKYQASITLYDSEDFSKNNVNKRHTYALQPLIFKSLNKNGVTDYFNGLKPTYELKEEFFNLGSLGDENEPLLAKAINQITGLHSPKKEITVTLPEVANSKDGFPFSKEMYIPISDLYLHR